MSLGSEDSFNPNAAMYQGHSAGELDDIADKYGPQQNAPAAQSLDTIAEKYGPQSKLDTAASYAGAFNHGIENVPSKVKYDVNSTLLHMGFGLGLIDDKEYEQRSKAQKQALDEEWNKEGTTYRAADVANHPTLSKVTRDIGALGTEIIGTGYASSAIKGAMALGDLGTVGNTIAGINDASLQTGVISALQASDNKAEAFAKGAGVGALVSAPFVMAGQLAKAAVAGGKSLEEINSSLENSNTLSKNIGVDFNLEQKLGSQGGVGSPDFFKNQQKQVMGSIENEAQSVTGKSIENLQNLNQTQQQSDIIGTIGSVYKNNSNTGSQMYDSWAQQAAMRGQPQLPNNAQKAAQELAPSISDNAALPDKVKNELLKVVQNVNGKEEMTPQELLNFKNSFTDQINKLGDTSTDLSKKVPLQTIRDAIQKDIEQVGIQTGTSDILEKAQGFWKNNVVPLEDIGLKSQKGLTSYGSIVKALDDPTSSGVVMDALSKASPEAQQQVKLALVSKSVQQATDKTGNLDPVKFLNIYRKTVQQNGLAFTTKDMQQAENLYQVIKKTGDLSENINNAKNTFSAAGSAVGATVGGGVGFLVGGHAGAMIGAGVGTAARTTYLAGLNVLSTTRAGQNILLAAMKAGANADTSYQLANGIMSLGSAVLKGGSAKAVTSNNGN